MRRRIASEPSMSLTNGQPTQKELASLKRYAEKNYRVFRREGPELDCGSTILKWPKGRASYAAREFNAAAELLEKHDPGFPKGFRL